MKIGIFGGSFNPPHKMHKKISLELIKNNYLDKVIFIPTGPSYEKKDLIEWKYRFNMLNIMTKNEPNLEVDNYENNSTLIYTYETLDYFRKKYKNDEIYFICGSDNLKELTTWKNYQYILENYKIIVIRRNNDSLKNIINKYKNYEDNIICTEEIIPMNSISSTSIRKMLKENKSLKILMEYIDENVLKYIKEEHIYK